MGIEDIPDFAALPDEDAWFSLSEIAELSSLSPALIQEFVEAGLLEQAVHSGTMLQLDSGCLVVARRACRLRADFDLNDSGTLLVLTLLQRVEALEARLRELECQLLRE